MNNIREMSQNLPSTSRQPTQSPKSVNESQGPSKPQNAECSQRPQNVRGIKIGDPVTVVKTVFQQSLKYRFDSLPQKSASPAKSSPSSAKPISSNQIRTPPRNTQSAPSTSAEKPATPQPTVHKDPEKSLSPLKLKTNDINGNDDSDEGEIFIDRPWTRKNQKDPMMEKICKDFYRQKTAVGTGYYMDVTNGIHYSNKLVEINESKITESTETLTPEEFSILCQHGMDALRRKTGKFCGEIEKCISCEENDRVCDCFEIDLDVPSETEDYSNDEIGSYTCRKENKIFISFKRKKNINENKSY